MTNEQQPPIINTQPAAAPNAAGKEAAPKIRRVGTLSMGLALILAGLTLSAFCLFPNWDLSMIFKLSPLILVFFGSEMIYAHAVGKHNKLKYDIFSMLVCCFLILAACGAAAASVVLQYYNPIHIATAEQIEQSIEEELYEVLAPTEEVGDIELYLNFNEFTPLEMISRENLNSIGHSHLNIYLKDNYQGNEPFAADCARLINLVKGVCTPDSLEFFNHNQSLSLYLSGRFDYDLTAEELAAKVNITENT